MLDQMTTNSMHSIPMERANGLSLQKTGWTLPLPLVKTVQFMLAPGTTSSMRSIPPMEIKFGTLILAVV